MESEEAVWARRKLLCRLANCIIFEHHIDGFVAVGLADGALRALGI